MTNRELMKDALVAAVMLTGSPVGAQAPPLVVDITSSGRICHPATYTATIDTDLSPAEKELHGGGATLVHGFTGPELASDGNAKLTLDTTEMLTTVDVFLFLTMT